MRDRRPKLASRPAAGQCEAARAFAAGNMNFDVAGRRNVAFDARCDT
jgi:hypothetical protein